MNFKTYAVRAMKSILYIAIIFFVLLGIMYFFSEKKNSNLGFLDTMIPKHNQLPMLAFIIVFGLVYPFITFIKKNVYLNKPFDEVRESIINIFTASNYELTDDNKQEKTIIFRPKNKISRVMRLMEDKVTVSYTDNPIVLNGMRKEVYRFAKHIEYITLKEDENN